MSAPDLFKFADDESIDILPSTDPKPPEVRFFGGGVSSDYKFIPGNRWKDQIFRSIPKPDVRIGRSIRPSTSEVSDLVVTGAGIVEPYWPHIEILSAMIVEIEDETIILDCLISRESKTYEERHFPRELFETVVPQERGSLVLVQIRTRPGEISVQFENGKGLVDPKDFDADHLLEGLEDSGLDTIGW